MERTSVLAVDDDPGILRIIQMTLDDEDIDLRVVPSGAAALTSLQETKPDVILLDVMMPGLSGIDVLREIRDGDDGAGLPVILLTAKDTNADKVKGLDLGADDYITKPFSVEELRARVRAVVRRTRNRQAFERIVQCGDVAVDLERRLVSKGRVRVALTRTEWLVLQELAMNAGRTLLNTQILTRVWGPEYSEDLAYLRVWISHLRQKLETDSGNPQVIKTVGRAGYMLAADPS